MGNGVGIGGDESFTDLIETSGTGNITITATAAQDVTTSYGITAFDMSAGGSGSGDSAVIQVASGLLSITGNVTAGTAQVTDNNSGGVTGVQINGGAIVKATAAGGSVTLAGDVSGATVALEASDTNGVNATGVDIDNYQGGGTTVSVVGSNNGSGGILTITGTGATLDTTYSTIAGNNVPYTQGVAINDEATLSAGANATIKITGTGGSVVTSQDSDVANSGNYTGGSEGVGIDGASITMGTGGTLTMIGTGGSVNAGYGTNAGDADSQGIDIGGDNGTTPLSLGTGGSMTFTGYGGTIDNSNALPITGKDMPSTQGVSIDSGAQVTAAGTTTIAITGTGGTITPGTNTDGDAIGVNIGSGDDNGGSDDAEPVNTLVSTESGSITITGYGGSSPNLSIGAEAHGFDGGSTTIETNDGGSISLTGTGGAGYTGNGTPSGNSLPSYGVGLFDGVTVSTNLTGSLSITGSGTGQAVGVSIREVNDSLLDSSPTLPVVNVGGPLTITATSGAGTGGLGEYLNGTFSAASAVVGTETSPGDSATITSGSLQIVDSTFTLSSSPIVEESAFISEGPIQFVIPPSSNFTAYGTGYVSATDAKGDADGIDIEGSTIDAEQGGSIALTGVGGQIYDGSANVEGDGVALSPDTAATTLETSGSGNITITATAGYPGAISDSGAYAFSDYGANQITVVNGTASITGTVFGEVNGTSEGGASLVGVEVGGGANIAATDTGSVTLKGDISGAHSVVTGSNFNFADGIEIGSESTVSVQDGTLTLNGTGTSINASGYDGEDRVFSTGVHLDNGSAISAGTDGVITVTGTIKSGAIGNGADLVGTLVTLNSSITGGTGSQIGLTGTTTGSNVISSAGGNSNVGLEIDNPVVSAPITEDLVKDQVENEAPSTTSLTIGSTGALTLTGTSGSIDGSQNTDQGNQAGAAGIDIDGTSQITVGFGTNVTMTGTGGAATVTTDPTSGLTAVTGGVVIDGVPITFDGHNTVTITGTGGSADNGTNVAGNDSNPATSVGVEFDYDSNSLVSVGTSGSLTVYGYGGAVSTVNASASAVGDTFAGSTGIGVHSDIEALGNSTISLHGYGGDITAGSSLDGVSFGTAVGGDSQAVTLSTQTGALTIYGQAGSAPNLGAGVALHGFSGNQSLIETASGTLTITGIGGAGNTGAGSFTGFFEPNYGVAALDDVEIKTTAGGTVSIIGTAGAGENNADGVGFATTSDTSVDPTPVDPDISATGAVTINALSGGGIVLASTTVEAPSLQIGNETSGDSGTFITSGPVRLLGATFTLTGPLTVYGSGGATGDPLTNAIEINGSTLDAGTGDILMNASGGTVNTVGLEVENSTIETADTGTLDLTGSVTTPNTGSDVVGVDLYESGLTTTTGKLSVTGTVSGSQQGSLGGLQVNNTTVASTTGAISLYGFVTGSTSATSGSVQALYIENGAQIQTVSGAIAGVGLVEVGNDKVDLIGLNVQEGSLTATGTGGSVTLLGNTGGTTTTDASNIGLEFNGTASTQDGTAGISLTGTAGGATIDSATSGIAYIEGAADTYGVTLSGNLSTTGNAPISITGYGGTLVDNSTGTYLLQSTGTDFYTSEGPGTLSTVNGTITITGTGGTSDNAGFGVGMVGYGASPFQVTSTTGEITVKGTAGASPTSESPEPSSTYEPNIGVVMGDNVSLSTGGAISITGQGIALASDQYTSGSGIAIQIDSFGGYEDGSYYDSNRTTPQLSAGGTISLTSLAGTVEVDEETQIPGNEISGNIIVTTPVMSDSSLLNNIKGTVTLEGDAGYEIDTDAALTVQTGTGDQGTIGVYDTAGIKLGALSASYLELDAFTGAITQTGAVQANQLNITSAGSVTLMNTGNNFSILYGIASSGALSIYTDPGLELTSTVQSGGPLLLESIGGGITLDYGAKVSDTGSGNVTLVTDQGFVNNSSADASAVSASNGVYYIYAGSPTNTNLGGLLPAFTQYNTTYPAGSSQSGNGLFYASNDTNSGGGGPPPPNPNPITPVVPPVVVAPPPPPVVYTAPYDPGVIPAPVFTSDPGGISQTGPESGGLAFASGGDGSVGAGDAAQLDNGQMNNVSNPHAAGELDDALSGPVHESLVDALSSVGAFTDTDVFGDTSDDEKKKKGDKEQIIGDGGVVEIGDGSVQQIPLSSAPKPLQDALGSGVMRGLQPAGH